MPDPALEAEYQTRRQRIDSKLQDHGWTVVAFGESTPLSAYTHHAVAEYPTANGPAAYVLFLDGRPASSQQKASLRSSA